MITSALIWMARSAARVGRKVGIACAGGKDDDAPFLEMAQGPAPDVRLRQLLHSDGGHDPRIEALLLENVLQRQGIDDGAKHPHVVRRHAVHAERGELRAAYHVPATDDQADLYASLDDGLDLIGEAVDALEVVSRAPVARQRLAGKFEQDSLVRGVRHAGKQG
jgi:hypothetical protein